MKFEVTVSKEKVTYEIDAENKKEAMAIAAAKYDADHDLVILCNAKTNTCHGKEGYTQLDECELDFDIDDSDI